jgi:anthranilate synthase component 2
VISPGPCSPAEAGISVAAIQHFAGKLPILGVCLGRGRLARPLAGIVRAQQLMHGKTSVITTTRGRVRRAARALHGEPLPLAGDQAQLPDLKVTAWTEDGEIMGVRHASLDIEGAVPPRVHPHRARPRHAQELPGALMSRAVAPRAGVHFIGCGTRRPSRGRSLS